MPKYQQPPNALSVQMSQPKNVDKRDSVILAKGGEAALRVCKVTDVPFPSIMPRYLSPPTRSRTMDRDGKRTEYSNKRSRRQCDHRRVPSIPEDQGSRSC